jgi:hypothetical protein
MVANNFLIDAQHQRGRYGRWMGQFAGTEYQRIVEKLTYRKVERIYILIKSEFEF